MLVATPEQGRAVPTELVCKSPSARLTAPSAWAAAAGIRRAPCCLANTGMRNPGAEVIQRHAIFESRAPLVAGDQT